MLSVFLMTSPLLSSTSTPLVLIALMSAAFISFTYRLGLVGWAAELTPFTRERGNNQQTVGSLCLHAYPATLRSRIGPRVHAMQCTANVCLRPSTNARMTRMPARPPSDYQRAQIGLAFSKTLPTIRPLSETAEARPVLFLAIEEAPPSAKPAAQFDASKLHLRIDSPTHLKENAGLSTNTHS